MGTIAKPMIALLCGFTKTFPLMFGLHFFQLSALVDTAAFFSLSYVRMATEEELPAVFKIILEGLESDNPSPRLEEVLGRQLQEETLPYDKQDGAFVLGLTGGSAAGKSTVASILEDFGAGIVECDKLGHKAYEFGSACFNQVVEEFGYDILDDDGNVDRRKLGAEVFKNPGKNHHRTCEFYT